MLLSISPEAFKRLERYLPRGLVHRDDAGSIDHAIGQLARLILMQRLHPGQKVPMDEIAESIGVSRTPVREAMRLLETEGLVHSLPNRGFAVRRLDPEETRNLYTARICMETYLAADAFRNRNKAFVSDLKALHRIYAQVLGGSGDRRRLGMLVDKAVHLRIAEQANNPYLVRVLANTFDRLILTRPLDGFPVDRMSFAVAEHEAILTAFEGESAKAAAAALGRNIEHGAAAIIKYLNTLEDFSVTA